ncbi:gluconokinase [Calidifontibacter sp. DB0510]|uniref:Gluconokinase n=1 Tax=Metallococcus carri TaxID=1656884 RepID=A0A967AYN6_9MICO|nr:gluconokinase [Metallococcus carri]NHN54245.1 gluconokinase [Metallococcus carri]NOP36915.1 gluconokinase [Calidifontibacter sp. DB2511S]
MAPVPALVVAGPAGSGKSTVGAALAEALRIPFIEGDDLHPPANIIKMTAGEPLTDTDREPWLRRVGETLAAHPQGVVASCSALRRSHRAVLVSRCPTALFIVLEVPAEKLWERLAARTGHFMRADMLDSQLATFESYSDEERHLRVDATQPLPALVETIVRTIADVPAAARGSHRP